MDDLRIEAVATRCLRCANLLADRHRVTPAYPASDLVYARQEHEIGLFVGDVRPMWVHVDCADPQLEKYNVIPRLDYCIRCRKPVVPSDIVQPVMQVTGTNVKNPHDPTDTGLTLGDRIHFVHVSCDEAEKAAFLRIFI